VVQHVLLLESLDYSRVVNVQNSLPSSVDFNTLSASKKSLHRINLNEFLTAYKSFDVYDHVQ